MKVKSISQEEKTVTADPVETESRRTFREGRSVVEIDQFPDFMRSCAGLSRREKSSKREKLKE